MAVVSEPAELAPLDDASAPPADTAEPHAAGRFADLALELHNTESLDETVQTVVDFALQALDCSHAGVTLVTSGGRPEIAAVTSPVVAEVYQAQIDHGSGPLLTVLAEQAPVLVHETHADKRWPEWADTVNALGVRSVLYVPLATRRGSKTVGALGLYSDKPDAFSADDEAVAHILARHASVAVATAHHEANMAQAIDARKLIGQAMGILMERYSIDGDQAFAVLRRYSQDHNQKLRVVAQNLIESRSLPEDDQA